MADETKVKDLVRKTSVKSRMELADLLGVPSDKRQLFMTALTAVEQKGYDTAINDVANKLADWKRR